MKTKLLLSITAICFAHTIVWAQPATSYGGEQGTATTAGTGGGFTNSYFGHEAGLINTGGNNTFIGYQSVLNNTTGIGNAFVGTNSGGANEGGNFNTFFGHVSGGSNIIGEENTFLGAFSGFNSEGSNNTYLGSRSGANNQTGSGNVFIGHNAGRNEMGSNLLYIANSNIGPPLIWGDFANDILRINGTLNINNSYSLPITDGTADQVLSTNGAGAVIWVDAATGGGNQNLESILGQGNNAEGNNLVNVGSIGIGTNMPVATLDVIGVVKIGNVNIPGAGTGYNLYVQNGILTEKVKIALKGDLDEWSWPDYVFEEDYPLKPLAEVETFIKQNKHLPGIPSTEEVVKEGIDLAQMDAKLLEKIEELMLYTIQQQKLIEIRAEQNAQQQKLIAQLIKRIEALEK